MISSYLLLYDLQLNKKRDTHCISLKCGNSIILPGIVNSKIKDVKIRLVKNLWIIPKKNSVHPFVVEGVKFAYNLQFVLMCTGAVN